MQQMAENTTAEIFEFVSFFVSGQSFCLEISQIREIRRWSPVTVLPHSPDYVLGVINLRGAVIPIYDLSRKLGFKETVPDERHVIIIVAIQDQTVGLLVDSVSEILSVAPDAMQEKPNIKEDTTADSVTGFITIEDSITRIINLAVIVEQPKEIDVE